MIRDRYDPVGLFELVPQLRRALEPELTELDRLLEDDVVFAQVKADFARRRPRSLGTGRSSRPVEVVLRLLVVKHLSQWSYAQTEHFVGDRLVLRQLCRLGLASAPDDTTLLRWANCLQPPTRRRLLDRVTELARALKVTRGRRLRLDSTVVETDVHHPSDSTLLADGVRVLSRLLRRARPLPAPGRARRRRLGLRDSAGGVRGGRDGRSIALAAGGGIAGGIPNGRDRAGAVPTGSPANRSGEERTEPDADGTTAVSYEPSAMPLRAWKKAVNAAPCAAAVARRAIHRLFTGEKVGGSTPSGDTTVPR
jgi:hypothetical protein